VTTKIAVNSLLSENKDIQEKGTAIMHNLAGKEVKSAVCIGSHFRLLPREITSYKHIRKQ
jgi:hypothetical protein